MSSSVNDEAKHFCNVCQLQLSSAADLALHDFSKKHCDNLLRLSKNKPTKSKNTKPTAEDPIKESTASTTVVPPAEIPNIALYGYFTPQSQTTKLPEYNTEYDPYLQKLADNPFKAVPTDPTNVVTPPSGAIGFSKGSKKKKRLCQICNVYLMNIPEYDAHMKSAQHAYKLKITGMGVSAHFVKASSDLHTAVDAAGEKEKVESTGVQQNVVPVAPSELFCDVCELLLNSVLQLQTHNLGKSHLENVKKKEKLIQKGKPGPDQLFCYTCKLSLTDLGQYNAHKNGKKHKIKCRQLLREGITIPPEERPADMKWSAYNLNMPIVYPELYQKEVVEKRQMAVISEEVSEKSQVSVQHNDTLPEIHQINELSGMYHCSKCGLKLNTVSKAEEHSKTHKEINSAPTQVAVQNSMDIQVQEETRFLFVCSICEISSYDREQFRNHLSSEEHALMVCEKLKAENVEIMLNRLMNDRRTIVIDSKGLRWCGLCDVASQTAEELEQHIESKVHKLADKEYEGRRLLELQEMVSCENGEFRCEYCKNGWTSLREYLTHLHTPTHRSSSRKDGNKKKWAFYHRKPYEEKNPGIRTKIGGTARDLVSGETETVSNLETLEPEIDAAKNVNIGLSSKKPHFGPRKTFVPSHRGVPPFPFSRPSRFPPPNHPMHYGFSGPPRIRNPYHNPWNGQDRNRWHPY